MKSLTREEGRALLAKTAKPSKYRSVKTEVDDILFASKSEARYYAQLKTMQRAGLISDLRIQPKFDLVVNKMFVCRYIADFSFVDMRDGKTQVVDVKSSATRTPVYRLKAKLMLAIHGITISEVFS